MEGKISYHSSDSLKMSSEKVRRKAKPLRSTQNGLLRTCNSIFATIQKDYYFPGLHIDFSKKRTETQLMDYL